MREKNVLIYLRPHDLESRLEGFSSIGFGGHVIRNDTLKSETIDIKTIWNAAKREILEEIGISLDSPEKPVGWVNEEETAVGKVHLGIVYIVPLGTNVKPLLTSECSNLRSAPFEDLRFVYHLEPWSRIIVKNFKKFHL